MVDVSRDPRWGRVSEGSGEDAYLGSQIAKAMVGINKMICQKQLILSCNILLCTVPQRVVTTIR
jgi:beta-glucosidase